MIDEDGSKTFPESCTITRNTLYKPDKFHCVLAVHCYAPILNALQNNIAEILNKKKTYNIRNPFLSF